LVTHKEGFVAGIQTCPENPYGGQTLDAQLDQVERLTGKVPDKAYVDRGYKGHGVPAERCRVLISGTRKLGYTLKGDGRLLDRSSNFSFLGVLTLWRTHRADRRFPGSGLQDLLEESILTGLLRRGHGGSKAFRFLDVIKSKRFEAKILSGTRAS
jgi:hypothetical protein